MRVLIFGGTGWLGLEIARQHIAAGNEVTCVARGGRPTAAGASLLSLDRDAGIAGYRRAELEGPWDEVVELTSIPRHAADAVTALGDRARHWTVVSSVSVYASDAEPGQVESAELVAPSDDPADYAGAKAAIERTAGTLLAGRLLVLRPGLIVGPGDPSDRFGSWLQRSALAGDGPLLVPAEDVPAQIIDARDVAAVVVRLGASEATGARNVVGDSMGLHTLVGHVRRAVGHTGPLVRADAAELADLDVRPWAGPRSLSLWVPPSHTGMGARSNAALLAEGIALRAIREIVSDVLADERERGLDRDRASGLTRAEELEVVAALGREAAGRPAPAPRPLHHDEGPVLTDGPFAGTHNA